jgi:hypothetical protein
MKYIKKFEGYNDEEQPLKECKWCDKEFVSKDNNLCCCKECDSKYNNYLANDNSESPYDKYVNNKKGESYW